MTFRQGWLAAWLLLATLFAVQGWRHDEYVQPVDAQSCQLEQCETQLASRPIESLRVGQRVLTDGCQRTTKTEVDPATWRKLSLQGVADWEDGTRDVVEIETLQSPDWLAENDTHVGAVVPLVGDLVEMGLPAGFPLQVRANEPCPEIEEGQGRVILTTINHLNNDVWELTFENERRERTSLRSTGLHKFYSLDRVDWISAKELNEGERIPGVAGVSRLISKQPLSGVHRVYNLTVEGDHVYRVSPQGLLVHNNGCNVKKFPNTPEEMDSLMGFPGTRQPDVNLQTGEPLPGRGRVDWDVSTPQGRMRVTYEQHPYHANAPDFHKEPHYHVDVPGTPYNHERYSPGDTIPGS